MRFMLFDTDFVGDYHAICHLVFLISAIRLLQPKQKLKKKKKPFATQEKITAAAAAAASAAPARAANE